MAVRAAYAPKQAALDSCGAEHFWVWDWRKEQEEYSISGAHFHGVNSMVAAELRVR